ncbi:MAG: RDD family protein, partial [Verrucomicrobia bacterium]
MILSGLIFCIGFLMIAFTERKQGLHDMIAGTYVIKD